MRAAGWLPGFANAHSHAFQRLLRGRVQRRGPSPMRTRDLPAQDTFWTWRETMYATATALSLDQLEGAARECYVECAEAGYTAVGEFHYVHHQPDGTRYDDPVATSRAMLRAARQVGIRLTLLYAVYARGGLRGEPLSERQQRFGAASLEEVERALDLLAAEPLVDNEMGSIGMAVHSVRAVPPAWLGPLAELTRERGLVLHAHASEQRAEVDECREVCGKSPIGLLAGEGVLTPSSFVVHATHLDDSDVATLAASGAGVCLCPTTEGDLGDGVPRTADLFAAGVPLSIGSDSHAVIDPFAELRSAEYQARAATGRRCVLVDDDGEVAPMLLERVGHTNGYAALGLRAHGDEVLLDTEARALRSGFSGDAPQHSSSVARGVSEPPPSQRDAMAVAMTAAHPGLVSRVRVRHEDIVVDGRHVGT